jgi:hypothetical protein
MALSIGAVRENVLRTASDERRCALPAAARAGTTATDRMILGLLTWQGSAGQVRATLEPRKIAGRIASNSVLGVSSSVSCGFADTSDELTSARDLSGLRGIMSASCVSVLVGAAGGR